MYNISMGRCLAYLASITVILTLTLIKDSHSVKHCIYKFRVPAADMDLSCPGLRTNELVDRHDDDYMDDEEEEGDEEELEEIEYMKEKVVSHFTKTPPQSYYDNPMTGSGDFIDMTPSTTTSSTTSTVPPVTTTQQQQQEYQHHKKRHRKKPRRGTKQRNNKTKKKLPLGDGLTEMLEEGAGGGPEPGFSAAEKQRTATLRKTEEGAVLGEGAAHQLLAGMARLVDQNGIQADQAAANSKIKDLEDSIRKQNDQYEELLTKTLQLSSQVHLLTSGRTEDYSDPQQHAIQKGAFDSYMGATSKLGCPVNHPDRIHKVTLLKDIYDRTIDVVPRSCYEWYKQGYTDSGIYEIDLDGLDGLPLLTVYCVMYDDRQVTLVEHNHPNRTWVKDAETPGSYMAHLKYNISDAQLDYLLQVSSHCEQHLKWECKGASIMFQSWWVSRRDIRMDYWPGGDPEAGGCACYVTDTCAKGRRCNCDANDPSRWYEDSGYVRDQSALPISKLYFGDTGGADEEGYFTVGGLRCHLNTSNPVSDVNAYLAIKTWPSIPVYCDYDGWLVLQRKHADGKLDFDRSWEHYKNGFGDLKGEFWIGLDNIYRLTNQKWQPMVLQIVIEFNNNIKMYATYDNFRIDDESKNYTIHVGRFTGTMSNEMRFIKGMQFTTKDRDNDKYTYGNCASVGDGGWWYTACGQVHLNGHIMWGDTQDAKTVTMKIRSLNPL